MLGEAPAESGGGGGGGIGSDGDVVDVFLATDVLTDNAAVRGRVIPDEACRAAGVVGVFDVVEFAVADDDGTAVDAAACC